MDSAKKAISSFMNHDGQHNTTIEQEQRAAITEEHVLPSRHEEVTTAIDKEVHQDHHRTLVQPIKAAEVLPEKHTHNALPVEHKTIDHTKPDATKTHLESDAAKYRDSSTTHATTHTNSVAPTVQGTHVHHHVHEHIQPVIQKQVAAPEVVHTTVPIHEKHFAETVHHDTKVLPVKTIDEFREHTKGLGGSAEAGAALRERRVGEYQGCAGDYVDGAGVCQDEKHGHAHAANHGSKAAVASAAARTALAGSSSNTAATTTTTTNNATATSPTTTSTQSRGQKVESLVDNATGNHQERSSKVSESNRAQRDSEIIKDTSTSKTSPTTAAAAGTVPSSFPFSGNNANNVTPGTGLSEPSRKSTTSSSSPTSSSHEHSRVSESALAQEKAERGGTYTTATGTTVGRNDAAIPRGSSTTTAGTVADPAMKETRRISLKDKLNPFKDADGDGKKGIMS